MINWRRLDEIRKRDGDARFARQMVNMINEGQIPLSEVSIRGLWEACGAPKLGMDRMLVESRSFKDDDDLLFEATDSSAFPTITGALINRYIQDAYNLEYGVGMQLVTRIPASKRDDVIVGFSEADGVKEVPEGMEYEESAFGEKYHMIRTRKFGRIVALTAEMVRFDQTGQMEQRARRVGELAKVKQEEIIFDAVLEKSSSGLYAAWRPGGTSTALYSDTSTDPYSNSTFDNVNTNNLVDESDLQENLALLGAAKDEKDNPITVTPSHVLTSPAKIMTARKLMRSGSDTRATYNQGIVNPFQGMFDPVASQWVTTTLSSVYWLLGDFRKQFVYPEVFPLQTFMARPGNDDEFKRDIVMAFKARFMGGCGAISNRYVVRSTGAS